MSALFELRLVDTEDDVTIVFTIALEPLDRPAASPTNAATRFCLINAICVDLWLVKL